MSKLRRQRAFEDAEIQSKLPEADAPQSRAVSAGDVSGDLLTTDDVHQPYWNLVDYGFDEQIGRRSYDSYRSRLTMVWSEIDRVLAPNGKFCLNAPIMPLRKAVSAEHFGKTHTRLLEEPCGVSQLRAR